MAANSTLIDELELLHDTSVALSSEIPFPEPADPFDGYVNITDNGVFENSNKTIGIRIFEYLSFDSWYVYVICAAAAIIVILSIIGLITWLSKHKTRVITESSDPVLTSSYQNKTSCCGCFPCCVRKHNATELRQNSASNLESYGRPPLPTSAYQAQRRRNSQESYTIDTSNLAMYIDTIEEVPNAEVSSQSRRPLPHHDIKQYLPRH